MPPALESVESRILDNVRTTCAAIVSGADYYTSVRKVHDMTAGPLEVRERPAVCIVHKGTSKGVHDVLGLLKCELGLDVYCVLDKTATWRRDIARFAADVEKALAATYWRGETADGQANAFDTYTENTALANESDDFPVALARVEVRIIFRHLFGDPTASL